MAEALLSIQGLKTGYGATEVLRGIDMAVLDREIVTVLGSNGVGKTTLNKVLSGVLPSWAGEIRFAGNRIDGRSAARIVEEGLIQVPEGRKIFPNLSIRENLELGSYRRGKPNRSRNLERIFTTFPRLKEREGQLAGTLSGGEQQMLAIGRGMMAEPLLLILDEPSLGLSPLVVEEMFGLIRQLNAGGLAILLVEQNVVQSLEVARRAYILENGVFALSGPSDEIARDPELKRTYLGL
ncbi:amino acid/amide ABC transporter ATP-binding protein 2 (HAAT family) [Azospirillum baldaniorum]|uniref:ABC transporter ATP-binding protein n=1 Tax=Azospirillum baldaniorum TaxID=1064539 RepID=UPI0011A0D740|nr:ABC transporter ATP-binding protein [Azospirillum baldaniorum]TWA70802.1 amino acid/amide ABC transporter ATP-binding protein 2 (HAAT family) [Azospirillum baldaniorum]